MIILTILSFSVGINVAWLIKWRRLRRRYEALDAEAFRLAAGVCEYRGNDEHGNPMCLKTGRSI